MKFQQPEAFVRSLTESMPDHLSHLYAVACQDDAERMWYVNEITRSIKASRPDIECVAGDATALDEEALFSPSLLATSRLISIQNLEKIDPKGTLSTALLSLPDDLFVVLHGGSLGKPLYEALKKEVFALDLSGDKPWERADRFGRHLTEEARRAGKQLTRDALAFMLQLLPHEFAPLCRELEKVICYVGERETIDLHAVQAICSARAETHGWKVSEELVWRGKVPKEGRVDPNDIFSLFGQLRYHLKTGLDIAHALESGGGAFPSLRPKQLETYKRIASHLSSTYFKKGLTALFECELRAKSTGAHLPLLWAHFTHTLLCARS